MKIPNFILAAIFIVFAYLQLNDPDPLGWTLVYLYMAAVCVFAAYNRANKYVLWAGIAAVLVWMGFLFPEFVSWIKTGMPDIAGQMKAEEPHIEFTREFLGLGICLAVLFWQLKNIKK
ncbi:MAG TPA: hypothetical protein ENJ95_18225 [Bacteroidetes bacterium]|nr:hypothetical protein [Bacteroidota bacterium]